MAGDGESADAAGLVHAWQFEAKGIQRWLFSSGRMRDVIGGSDLAAHIAATDGNDLIGLAIVECGLAVADAIVPGNEPDRLSFSRRAGGVFCVHCIGRDTLVKLRRAFLLRYLAALPGLEYEDCLGSGANEIASRKDANSRRAGLRGNELASVLPLGRPVFASNPRSGLPQTGSKTYGKGADRRTVPFDQVLEPMRRRADDLQTRFASVTRDNSNRLSFIIDGAARRFHSRTRADGIFVYPRNLADDEEDSERNPLFPWMDGNDDRRIALVHADISGLGEIFQSYKATSASEALKLGAGIEEAILAAIGTAADACLLPHAAPGQDWDDIVPARPIVVGGDDITVLVRADLALPFAARLLEEIEQETGKIDAIKQISGGLSACAGVAISRSGQPFLAMNALAESLCKFAKAKAKSVERPEKTPWPSLLAFHVHSQTALEDYERDIHPHLVVGDYPLTSNPFAIGNAAARTLGCPSWGDLVSLAAAIGAVSGAASTMRSLAGELAKAEQADTGLAKATWRRLWLRRDRDAAEAEALRSLEALLGKLEPGGRVSDAIPRLGAMFDALELIDLDVPLGGVAPHAAPETELMETVG